MNLTNLTDARSLAAVARVEADRKRWLWTYRNAPEEQRALSQAWYDEKASEALTIGLADEVCREYPEVC